MSKWNANITGSQLLNKLVKPTDTVKARNEINSNIKKLRKSVDHFKLTDGFKAFETTLGSDKIGIILSSFYRHFIKR